MNSGHTGIFNGKLAASELTATIMVALVTIGSEQAQKRSIKRAEPEPESEEGSPLALVPQHIRPNLLLDSRLRRVIASCDDLANRKADKIVTMFTFVW